MVTKIRLPKGFAWANYLCQYDSRLTTTDGSILILFFTSYVSFRTAHRFYIYHEKDRKHGKEFINKNK